jgi:integrase
LDDSHVFRRGSLLSARLIAAAVERARGKNKDVWRSDNIGLRGAGRLVIRISPTGASRFYFRHAKGGKRPIVSLGPYSRTARKNYLTLEQARTIARNLSAPLLQPTGVQLANHPQDTSPASHTNHVNDELHAGDSLTLIELCRAYAADLERRGRVSAKQVGQELERYIAHLEIATELARNVTPERFVDLLRAHLEQKHLRTARRLRSHLHAAYQASLNARLDPGASPALIDPMLKSNPLAHVRSVSGGNAARDRNLSQAELSDFWRRLTSMRDEINTSVPVRALRLTVLLGGQRCEQLLRVRVEHVNFETESIVLLDPKGRRDTPRVHSLPLLTDALEDVRWLVKNSSDAGSEYLFPGGRENKTLHTSSVSGVVTQIRKEMMC